MENPIVLLVILTNPPNSVESNFTEWSFKIKFGRAIHPEPFPPVIFIVGSVK